MAKLTLSKNELKHLRKNGYTNEDIRILKSKVEYNTHQTIISVDKSTWRII